jgi:bile acid:Na+ symporter, BASS family
MGANVITQLFLPLALAIIMFGMGLSLTFGDFKRILIYPKAVTLGLFNQLILLPIVAFGLIHLFGLEPELAVGLMILAACPGGATSNLITHLSKGDGALSITLTAFSSLITVITIPFLVNFSLVYFLPAGEAQQLNVLGTVLSVLIITIVPVILGMLILKNSPELAKKWEVLFKKISAIFFVIILIAAILKEKDHMLDFFIQAGPVALVLNLSTLALGYFSGRIFKLDPKQSITVAIESGIQNGTLGITIAATLLVNSVMSIPSAIYSLIMFGTAAVIIISGNRRKENEPLLGSELSPPVKIKQ